MTTYKNEKLFPGGLRPNIIFPFLSIYQESEPIREGCISCECGRCGPCSCITRCGDKVRQLMKLKTISWDEAKTLFLQWIDSNAGKWYKPEQKTWEDFLNG